MVNEPTYPEIEVHLPLSGGKAGENLKFPYLEGQSTIKLQNNSLTQKYAFKLKTNNHPAYQIAPVKGVLDANHNITIVVVRTRKPFKDDKLQISIVPISEADAKREIDDVFKRDDSKVMHKTINCLRG
ncbi:hypothetical protein WR25_04699 [Diploscapter pachys]|uniref:Major sperm protein n=1 Tax=Diploscapter pachys TaxID=2018661 RepID=A0A2A2J6G0_9BILA|nr:hypothetical protein WR25_04699 [Diploscapter pachys]